MHELDNSFPALFRAWYKTRYRVHFPTGAIDFILGETNVEIDRQLDGHQVNQWTMLTGWNPDSRVCSDAENARANERLSAELDERGWVHFPSEGIPETDDWVAEQGFFVANLSPREARDLGQRYGQMAVLYGARGAFPWLLFPQFDRFLTPMESVSKTSDFEEAIRRVARQTIERNISLE